MKPIPPNYSWLNDWTNDESGKQAHHLANELVTIFLKFWNTLSLSSKSKTTQYRYSSGLHALGGHLIDIAAHEESTISSTKKFVLDNISKDGGPLIFHDEVVWQNELDVMCKKLFKYLEQNTV